MIVGDRTISIDLYCDAAGPHEYEKASATFTGWPRRSVLAAARKAGWRLDLEHHTAYCPKHASHPNPEPEEPKP
jgi:hypothetical protein